LKKIKITQYFDKYILLSICNMSYHFEDNRVLNDILKRLYTFPC
jgi:hypothetical protein